jgi:membrane protease YdiL (CAAX protease family)
VLCLVAGLALTPWIFIDISRGGEQLTESITECDEAFEEISFAQKVLLMPLLEEIVFRSWIFLLVLRKVNRKYIYVAILITSVVFALCHVNNGGVYVLPSVLTMITIRAVLLGWLVLKTGSLIDSVLAHMGLNFIGCTI